MNFNKFSVQTKAQTNCNAISPHAAGLAQLADEIIRQRFGSVIVIEGEHRHRIQLAQALANQMGYRMDLGLVTSKYIGETEKNVESLFAGANNPRILSQGQVAQVPGFSLIPSVRWWGFSAAKTQISNYRNSSPYLITVSTMPISTRRFFSRASWLFLLTRGLDFPKPLVVMISGGIPDFTR